MYPAKGPSPGKVSRSANLTMRHEGRRAFDSLFITKINSAEKRLDSSMAVSGALRDGSVKSVGQITFLGGNMFRFLLSEGEMKALAHSHAVVKNVQFFQVHRDANNLSCII